MAAEAEVEVAMPVAEVAAAAEEKPTVGRRGTGRRWWWKRLCDGRRARSQCRGDDDQSLQHARISIGVCDRHGAWMSRLILIVLLQCYNNILAK